MGNFLLYVLAAEAHSAGEGGFGLNFNLLETNLINLAILIGVLFYFGRNIVADTLTQRQARIAEEIQEAEQRQQEAASALATEREKLAQATAEAERIRKSAADSAQKAKEAIAAQTKKDIERMRETAAKDLSSERDKAISQLKKRVAQMAIDRVTDRLQGHLDESAQKQLIDRSIAQLGGS